MKEQYYEKLLNIKTCGEQKIFNESLHYNRYEPTSYYVLDILFKEYKINKDDHIIDFGCGKGRLNFYVNYFYDIECTGIEMNSFFYEEAISNRNSYIKKYKKDKNKINLLNCFAEEYKIKPLDNKFYFFNPFSIQIFIKVLGNILDSVEKHETIIDIILYYPSDDYIYYIENNTAFVFIEEIPIHNKYEKNNRQRLLIYRLFL